MTTHTRWTTASAASSAPPPHKRLLHPVVAEAVDGFNTALIAVGCTGSGKTTLLHGRTGGEGTVRLAIKGVFEALHNKTAQVGVALSQQKAGGGGGAAMEFAVDASFCEVYEERCRDLFAAAAAGAGAGKGGNDNNNNSSGHHHYLEVEESADEGWHVAGLTFRSAPDAQSLQAAYAAALSARATGLSEYGHSKHDRAASVLTPRISHRAPRWRTAGVVAAAAAAVTSSAVELPHSISCPLLSSSTPRGGAAGDGSGGAAITRGGEVESSHQRDGRSDSRALHAASRVRGTR